jgi:hypothetical protein
MAMEAGAILVSIVSIATSSISGLQTQAFRRASRLPAAAAVDNWLVGQLQSKQTINRVWIAAFWHSYDSQKRRILCMDFSVEPLQVPCA